MSTPRELLAEADYWRNLARQAEAVRNGVRIGRRVTMHRNKLWQHGEPLAQDVTQAIYEAACEVRNDAEQRAKDLEAKLVVQ